MISRILGFASVCLLLLIFLAGDTGISLYIHTCGGSQKKDVLVFREIFHQKIDCCCDENATASLPRNPASSLNDDDCCRISHLFIKVPFPGFPILEKFSVPAFQTPEYPDLAILKVHSPQAPKSLSNLFPGPSPPPIFGVTLVHFLHQMRIPDPVC